MVRSLKVQEGVFKEREAELESRSKQLALRDSELAGALASASKKSTLHEKALAEVCDL